jgi:serine/threonine protein kinase
MIEMEYIEGGQLKRYLKRDIPLSEGEVSKIMKSILEGVNYIHDKDYIHRDLKPENVMIKEKGGYDVKIVDFGLSATYKVFNNEKIDEKIGTLMYMAPE